MKLHGTPVKNVVIDPKTGKLKRIHKFKSVSQRIASEKKPKQRYAKATKS